LPGHINTEWAAYVAWNNEKGVSVLEIGAVKVVVEEEEKAAAERRQRQTSQKGQMKKEVTPNEEKAKSVQERHDEDPMPCL
jgi:hypothetical protein